MNIPDTPAQYWTVKLAFLAYLIHPQTKVSSRLLIIDRH